MNTKAIGMMMVLLAFVPSAVAQFQRPLADLSVKDCIVKVDGGAVTGDAQVNQDGNDPVFSIPYDFTEDGSALRFQAESATQNGATKYGDANATGGFAMGEFGEAAGDSLEFQNVPPAEQLNIHFNNGTGTAKRAGLYVNGTRVTTLAFPDTGGWRVPFQTVSYEGSVSGTVRIQVDADDVAANQTFCCNVDEISLGKVPVPGSLEVSFPVKTDVLQTGDQAFSLAIGAVPLRLAFGIEDDKGIIHWSPQCRHETAWDWGRLTALAYDLEPALDAKAKVVALRVRATGNGSPSKGALRIKTPLVSQGWPSTPPPACPINSSETFAGIRFTGRHAEYTNADTWYPTRDADDVMYSPYTDGKVSDVFVRSDNADATTGHARIEGNDPMNLRVTDLGCYLSRPWPFATRYPCGSLMHNGIWYYGTYILNGDGRPDGKITFQGPFVGFRYSKDKGATWVETPCTPLNNLFGELVDRVPGGYTKVKMGSPHFVDFGRNMEHSPDGKAYLIAHGNTDIAAPQSWILGDRIYLARVTPSPETINDRKAYEFLGRDGRWTNDFKDIHPLIDWPGRTGCVTATYNPGLRLYLMCVSVGRLDTSTFDTYILESERLEGPWRMISYMEDFGRQAYFVNIPSKFTSEDGMTMWLCYAANWTGHEASPKGGRYAMNLQEFQLVHR